MPCKATDINIDLSGNPGPSIPGFGIPQSPLQIPLPNLDLPTDLLEDFMDLVNRLGLLLPSGLLKPNPQFPMKNIWDYVSNLLSQFAPFLSFYNFIMAALKLFVCIIEVLCAIPNPFAVANKLIVLFRDCIPPFLAMFPFAALIAMILSLLLLIIALVTYIIETILNIIEEFLRNLAIFQDALTLQDATSTLAAAQKLASLLCFIDNLLSIFVALAAIMAVIQSLAKLAGFGICDSSDEEGCCAEALCPTWLGTNKEITVQTTGQLLYLNNIGSDLSSLALPEALTTSLASMLTLRSERWQVYDTDVDTTLPISLIVTPTEATDSFPSHIFFPEQEFASDTQPGQAAYVVDLQFTIDPIVFNSEDILGSRVIQIKDCIVVRKPRIGVLQYDNTLSTSISTGTFDLEGGLAYEEDGETPYLVDGTQATLNTFLHLDSYNSTDLPLFDDGYYIDDVTFTWKPNHPILASYDLITIGCIPEVSVEKAIQNAIMQSEGIQDVATKLAVLPDGDLVPSTGFLPNVTGAQECVQDALNTLRQNITFETVGLFQATAETCLNDLLNQASTAYCGAFIAGVSQFKSTFTVEPDSQFTTRTIKIFVFLRDPGGTLISTNVPASCFDSITEKLEADVSLGQVGEFTYDSSTNSFVADLTSEESGLGTLKMTFDGKIFSTFVPGTAIDVPSSIIETEVGYEFVDAVFEPAVRRGESDIANQGE